MIGIIIAGHGDVAEGLLSAAQLIMGQLEQVTPLGLRAGMAPESFGEVVAEEAGRLDTGEGVLILTDLRGGTPFNQACLAARDQAWAVVSGMSLPMLVHAAHARLFTPLATLITEVKTAGSDGIISINGKAL